MKECVLKCAVWWVSECLRVPKNLNSLSEKEKVRLKITIKPAYLFLVVQAMQLYDLVEF